ncbi:MAG TPA: hypothetical protein VF610_01450, partial [Segetibacter sp.]
GWSPVAITKPRGLSFALQLNKLVNIKVTYIVSILIAKIEGIKDVYTRYLLYRVLIIQQIPQLFVRR